MFKYENFIKQVSEVGNIGWF